MRFDRLKIMAEYLPEQDQALFATITDTKHLTVLKVSKNDYDVDIGRPKR